MKTCARVTAVWRPKHENTLIVKLAIINLYNKMPYGGSVGEFSRLFAACAARPIVGITGFYGLGVVN